jgi:hypothetical protein
VAEHGVSIRDNNRQILVVPFEHIECVIEVQSPKSRA